MLETERNGDRFRTNLISLLPFHSLIVGFDDQIA